MGHKILIFSISSQWFLEVLSDCLAGWVAAQPPLCHQASEPHMGTWVPRSCRGAGAITLTRPAHLPSISPQAQPKTLSSPKPGPFPIMSRVLSWCNAAYF